MKAIFFLFIAALVFDSCNTGQQTNDKKRDTTTVIAPKHKTAWDIAKCKSQDTLDPLTGIAVRYVANDSSFDVEVSWKNWKRKLGYEFDCDVTQSLVPVYEWSSDRVIALKKGCGGNSCSHHFYYIIGTDTEYDRDDVLAFDSKHNLILQIVRADSVAIENIYTTKRITYPIKDSLLCATPLTCIEEASFKKSSVSFKWQATKNNVDKIVTRTFAVPPQLYNN